MCHNLCQEAGTAVGTGLLGRLHSLIGHRHSEKPASAPPKGDPELHEPARLVCPVRVRQLPGRVPRNHWLAKVLPNDASNAPREALGMRDARTFIRDLLAMLQPEFGAALTDSPTRCAGRRGLPRNATVVPSQPTVCRCARWPSAHRAEVSVPAPLQPPARLRARFNTPRRNPAAA